MENTARLYHCARCHRQVVICRQCDRGNIYCPDGCAEEARRTSLRAAGCRYQQTRRGRLKHAERQRRYRARTQKVTHQGSLVVSADDPLSADPERPAPSNEVGSAPAGAIHCHFCRRACSPFLRQDFLHRTAVTDRSGVLSTPWPPAARARAP